MKGVIIHAPHDLRIEPIEVVPPAAGQLRIEIKAGGICGSDLHYYHHGGFGTVRLREPMALGHEIAGVVAEVGAGVMGVAAGDRVAVNPSLPCGVCFYCRQGMRNECLDMEFMGSAMRFPHAQGGFRQSVTVDVSQAVAIPSSLSYAEAAVAEPLAVCLHAAHRAGSLMGKSVLITGCGPIGALLTLVARHAGAATIVVTDVSSFALDFASRLGATRTINVAAAPEALAEYGVNKGTFDVVFEASGNSAALGDAIKAVRAGGTIVQVGLAGDMAFSMNLVVTKEVSLIGTFRFDTEFALAIELMGKGLIDVRPLLSHTLTFTDAGAAFELASDRSKAMKVQLSF